MSTAQHSLLGLGELSSSRAIEKNEIDGYPFVEPLYI